MFKSGNFVLLILICIIKYMPKYKEWKIPSNLGTTDVICFCKY